MTNLNDTAARTLLGTTGIMTVPIKPHLFFVNDSDDCPICGGLKTGKYSCRKCIDTFGNTATYAIRQAMDALDAVMDGFNKNREPAEIVFWFIAQQRIGENAQPYANDTESAESKEARGQWAERLWWNTKVGNGQLHTTGYGYGQADLGTTQTALVILKRRYETTEYYTPKLVAKIIADLGKKQEIKNKQTKESLAAALKAKTWWVQNKAEKYREKNPDYFLKVKEYRYYLNVMRLTWPSSDVQIVFDGNIDEQFPSHEVEFFYKGFYTKTRVGFRGVE